MSVQDKLDRIETMEDLFDLTIDIAKRSVLVSSLAYVESVNEGDKYSVVTVKPFPLMKDQTEYTINAYCNNDLAEDLSAKDIVVVLFTDLDFRSSLNNNSTMQPEVEKTKVNLAIPICLSVILHVGGVL